MSFPPQQHLPLATNGDFDGDELSLFLGKSQANAKPLVDKKTDVLPISVIESILSNADKSHRALQEAVWMSINALPEQQRNDVFAAVKNEAAQNHPIFIKIYQAALEAVKQSATK